MLTVTAFELPQKAISLSGYHGEYNQPGKRSFLSAMPRWQSLFADVPIVSGNEPDSVVEVEAHACEKESDTIDDVGDPIGDKGDYACDDAIDVIDDKGDDASKESDD